jgi:hypothetical protein
LVALKALEVLLLQELDVLLKELDVLLPLLDLGPLEGAHERDEGRDGGAVAL